MMPRFPMPSRKLMGQESTVQAQKEVAKILTIIVDQLIILMQTH